MMISMHDCCDKSVFSNHDNYTPALLLAYTSLLWYSVQYTTQYIVHNYYTPYSTLLSI